MNKWLVGLLIAGNFLFLACKTNNSDRDNSSDGKGLFQPDALWAHAHATLCFADHASGSQQLRAKIKAILEKEINERTAFRFDGFRLCSNSPDAHIEVRILSKGKANSGSVGRPQNSIFNLLSHFIPNYRLREPMELYLSWNTGISITDIEMHNIIVHEFGHALGLHHEQSRGDNADGSLCNKQVDPQPTGSLAVGSFDFNSIMNYCNPYYFTKYITLSAGDIATVKTAYDALATREGRGELLRCEKVGLQKCIQSNGGAGCAVKYCLGGTYLCDNRSALEECLSGNGGLSCLAKGGCTGS